MLFYERFFSYILLCDIFKIYIKVLLPKNKNNKIELAFDICT